MRKRLERLADTLEATTPVKPTLVLLAAEGGFQRWGDETSPLWSTPEEALAANPECEQEPVIFQICDCRKRRD